jgi:GTP 3',8-cyclase
MWPAGSAGRLLPLRRRFFDGAQAARLAPMASSTKLEPLRDGHARLISDLRVSVTDRCNFRCQYCMPAEGLPWLDRSEILSFEEIERLVRLTVAMGISDVRLTGGEPLVRREFPKLVRMLATIEGLEDLSLTTNGYLLERMAGELAAAGLRRINVSLDSLSRDRFFQMTRRDALPRVIAGLEALERYPELSPVKVNCVAMRGFTEDEVIPFARLARRKPYQVRFIEFMPLDADHAWSEDRVLTGREIREMIDRVYPLEPLGRESHATAKLYRFRDGKGEIGFINPVSEPFCADCNRIRLTAEGKLRTCLFSLYETDLREPLRSGANDAELERIIREAVWRKELKHHVSEPGFRQPARTMSRIGG